MAGSLQLSSKHKVYAALLAIAVGAMAYDRFHSWEPAAARAAVLPVPSETAAVTAPGDGVGGLADPGAALPPSSDEGDMAARLRGVAAAAGDPLAGLRDAFAPPQAWAAVRQAAMPDPGAGVDAAAFVAGHLLSVVMLSGRGGGGSAVIGGRLVRVGQAVDGYRLTTVRPRSARLSGPDGAAVELRLP